MRLGCVHLIMAVGIIILLAVLLFAGAANGFVTTRPDARYGDTEGSIYSDRCYANQFTVPGTGSIEISEIGLYCDGAGGSLLRLAIFTNDAANSCPEEIVANSDSGELDTSAATYDAPFYATYSTKPVVTGGSTYWIVAYGNSSNTEMSRFDSVGTYVQISSGLTYPTWPTGTQWESATSYTREYSFYAVLSGGSGGSGGQRMMLMGVGQ